MTEYLTIAAEDIDVAVTIHREHQDDYDMLRCFSASVDYAGEEVVDPVEIGSVRGWICWDVYSGRLSEAGDAVSRDALDLAAAVEGIRDSERCAWIDAALMIDRMGLESQWRGRRLSGVIIEKLRDLLGLDPAHTIVVLHPEPQQLEQSGPYEEGPERDAAMEKLQSAYRVAGLEPWGEAGVWWLRTD